jgi:hypothetical protein
MLDNYGVKLRSESFFCTGKFSHAYAYGKIFYVIPIGKYNYYYHEKIKDLYGWIHTYEGRLKL